jgi:hypothetical protein
MLMECFGEFILVGDFLTSPLLFSFFIGIGFGFAYRAFAYRAQHVYCVPIKGLPTHPLDVASYLHTLSVK